MDLKAHKPNGNAKRATAMMVGVPGSHEVVHAGEGDASTDAKGEIETAALTGAAKTTVSSTEPKV